MSYRKNDSLFNPIRSMNFSDYLATFREEDIPRMQRFL